MLPSLLPKGKEETVCSHNVQLQHFWSLALVIVIRHYLCDCWMWIFFLLQQSVHIFLGRMLKSRATFPERCSSVHPKGRNLEEIICCQVERNNSVIKLQKLPSLIEIWSKMRTSEGLLKAFLTVEIVVVFSDLFFHLFLKQNAQSCPL